MAVREIELKLPAPHPGQSKMLNECKRFNVAACGRRLGKTDLGISYIVAPVILAGWPFGWFSASNKILEDAWQTAIERFEPITTYKNENKHIIKVIGGGKLEFWSMEAKLVARSRKYKEVIVDEAAHIEDLKKRFDYEIRPTLADYEGGAWFLSSPNGENDFYEFYQRGGVEPGWQSWAMPTWANPFIPLAEIEHIKKLPHLILNQEYGAEFLSGSNYFVESAWVDACGLWGNKMPVFDHQTPIIVGIDAASKSDTFAIVGIYKDYDADDGRFTVAFSRVFEPSELLDQSSGIITYNKPRAFVNEIADNYNVVAFAYDPYQLVDFAGSLMQAGVGLFIEFPQGPKRAFADRHLYELIRDGRLAYDAQNHAILATHIKNANAKVAEGDKLRIIKRTEDKKIDAAVACSMACYTATEYNI